MSLRSDKVILFGCVSLQLFDIARRYDTLLNVIRSLTKNIQSIFLTAMLALILIYVFTILGYVFFNDDFVVDVQALSGQCSSITEEGGIGSGTRSTQGQCRVHTGWY